MYMRVQHVCLDGQRVNSTNSKVWGRGRGGVWGGGGEGWYMHAPVPYTCHLPETYAYIHMCMCPIML